MAGTTTLDESRHPHGESETAEPHQPDEGDEHHHGGVAPNRPVISRQEGVLRHAPIGK